MINFDDCVNGSKTKHNLKWPYIPNHQYRIRITGVQDLEKQMHCWIQNYNQPDIDKRYLYAKDPYKSKYQFLISKSESTGLKHFNNPKPFTEYSSDMKDVYKNIDEYNTNKERKVLIDFDDMITDMINNKKLNSIVFELFIRGRNLNISLVFITQSYFKGPKDVRLISTHFFIMKISTCKGVNRCGIDNGKCTEGTCNKSQRWCKLKKGI